jgi:ligand-binding sensor domain-containing protein
MGGGKRRWWWIAGCITAAITASGTFVAWRASRAVRISTEEVRTERQISLEVRPFLPPVTSIFEPVHSPEIFQQAVRFQNHLYIAGPAGLCEYDSVGALSREFRVGRDLPGSPLVDVSVGVLADSSELELLIATAEQGILVFDGRAFRRIYPADAQIREITSILPVSAGHLLIGTKKRGVLLYDGKTIRELHATLGRMYVTALAGTEVDLWVGTLDQGVKHWHAGTTETFGEAEGLPDAQVQAIAFAKEKTYVGTPLGVAEFEGGRFSRVLGAGVLTTALLVNRDALLIGSQDQGVVRVPLQVRRGVAAARSGSAELGEVRQFLETEEGVLVVTRSGVFEMNPRGLGWKEVLKPRAAVLSDRNISALAKDKRGQLWVGYFNRGLDILPSDLPGQPSKGLDRTVHVENDRVFCINRIWPDVKADRVEVATANGLVRFGASGNQEQVLTRSDGLIADHVTDVVPYRDGLAVATPAGITFLDADGARSLYGFHGLVNNHVYALGVSGDDLMVGTLGGLSSIEKGFVRANYTAGRSGLKQNWITALARVDDEWMIGTYGSGVVGMDGAGKFNVYETASGLLEINPNAMLVTPAHVFAGTLGDGLLVYDREKRRWTVLSEGLPSGNVTALTEGNGYVYVGTDNGLVRVQENKLRP